MLALSPTYRQIPELMFHMEELRALVKKYNQVMQRYFVQFLAGYDAAVLNQLVQVRQITTPFWKYL